MAQFEDGQLKIIMGRKSDEEILYVIVQNMSEVESHLGDVDLR